jgi:tight adherence protein B
MQLVIVTFVCILVLVYGIYWVLVLRPEQREQAALRKRLAATGSVVAVTGSVLEQPRQNLSQVRALNVVLERSKGLSGPLETLVTQSGLKISVGTLLLACALVAVVTFFLVKLVTYYSLLALSVAACTATIPYFLVRYTRTRRLATFEEQFPDAIEMMARALRAGHAFPTGILMVADEMPAPVGPEFRLLYDRQNFGMPVPDALKGFAERIPIIDARFFVTAVLTQRETGGNLSEVLDNLATVIRDRFKVKRQVRAVTAHGRITGWILSALPPSLAGILCIISPEYMKLLITDPLGMQMIGVGLFMQIVGTLIIRKLVNVPY